MLVGRWEILAAILYRETFWTPIDLNPFFPNAPFLYSLKKSENLTIFWCFQGVEEGIIGNKWVNRISLRYYSIRTLMYFLRELFLNLDYIIQGYNFEFFYLFESSLLDYRIKIKWRGEFWRVTSDGQDDKLVELAKLISKLTATPINV